MTPKHLIPREGYQNRHLNSLPKEPVQMYIIVYNRHGDEEDEFLCKWCPYDPNDYPSNDQPYEGFLGTARSVRLGIGWHAWEQNNHEFVYYKLV